VVKDCANCRHDSIDRRVAFTLVLKLAGYSVDERLINFSKRERYSNCLGKVTSIDESSFSSITSPP
jgi:hypothetical protein